jgi:Hemerythrin HHE cation binding domain
MSREVDPYAEHDVHLRRIHAALGERLRSLLDARLPAQELIERTRWIAEALLWHHHAESTILFPRLRLEGRTRSVDVSFLDACDRDHHVLEGMCRRLLVAAEAPHARPSEIISLATDIGPLLAKHVAEEEAGLAPARLRSMIGADGLRAIAREAETERANAIRARA